MRVIRLSDLGEYGGFRVSNPGEPSFIIDDGDFDVIRELELDEEVFEEAPLEPTGTRLFV